MLPSSSINSINQRNLYLENQKLREELSNMNYELIKLSTINHELTTKISILTANESRIASLEQDLRDKNEEIKRLQEKQKEILKDSSSKIQEKDTAFLKEVTKLKCQIDSNTNKVETAVNFVKLNQLQHNKILELEQKIKDLEEQEKKKIQQNDLEHEVQYTNLKQKMMDRIKTAQKNMAQSNNDNMDLNTKLSKLATNQLLIELESQSNQIEELIKAREKYTKKIFVLRTDLNTHKKVEQLLQEKNKKYLELVKNFDKKNQNQNQSLDKNTKLNYTTSNFNFDSSSSMRMNTEPNKKKSVKYDFEKLYRQQTKMIDNLRDVNDTLKSKINYYEKKYSGIINLYKMALDNLTKDEKFKGLSDVYVNINEIKNGDFEKFTNEQKYSILVFLIKQLLPLIETDDEENSIDKIKEEFKNVDINGSENIYNKTSMNYNSYNKLRKRNIIKNNCLYKNGSNSSRQFEKFPKIDHLFYQNNSKDVLSLYKFLSIK